jgi:hypothetical protein
MTKIVRREDSCLGLKGKFSGDFMAEMLVVEVSCCISFSLNVSNQNFYGIKVKHRRNFIPSKLASLQHSH